MAKRMLLSADDFLDQQGNGELKEDGVEKAPAPTLSPEPAPEPAPQTQPEPTPAPTPMPQPVVEAKKEVTTVESAIEKPAKKPKGRRPNEVPTERDFISINIAGIREGLELLCTRESLLNKRKISYNEYINKVLKEHLEQNKQIIEAMKATALM